MVNVAAQLVELELDLRALIEDIQLGGIDTDECKSRLAALIKRQTELWKSLSSSDPR